MKFSLEVGEAERHIVEFSFNQLLGTLDIRVDQQKIKHRVRLINEPMSETHTLQIGECERTSVRIEKERTSTFTQKCVVYVNERLYKCYAGA